MYPLCGTGTLVKAPGKLLEQGDAGAFRKGMQRRDLRDPVHKRQLYPSYQRILSGEAYRALSLGSGKEQERQKNKQLESGCLILLALNKLRKTIAPQVHLYYI